VGDHGLLVVIVVSLMLNVIGLDWGLPPDLYFAWDVDGIAPLGPLVAAKRMFIDDWWNSGYYNKFPMGHFFLLMGAYAPYLGYLWLTRGLSSPSELYPFGFRDPETALTVLSLIARGISAVMGVGIVVLVYLTVRRAAGRPAALFSAFSIAFSPAFIFYAHTGNVDTPSLFWSALALFALGRLLAGQCKLRNYVLLGSAAGMAVATKEQTAGLFLLLPLSVLILHAWHSRPVPQARWPVVGASLEGKPLAALAASIATFVVATHLIFNWDGNMLRFRWRIYGIHPTVGTDYGGSTLLQTVDKRISLQLEAILDAIAKTAAYTWEVMNPILFVAGIAGVLALPLYHRWARHFGLALGSYTVFAVALFPFFRARFVLEVALVLALFAGPVLSSLWNLALNRCRALVVVLVLIWAYSFAYGAEVDYLLVRDARYTAEKWFATNSTPGATVEAYSAPVYLPRFPRHLKVRSSDLTSDELAGLKERSPDFVVLSSAYSERFQRDPEKNALLTSLLGGEFGYRPVLIFRRDPLISPRPIPGLSPEIVVLANRR
jgi:4-amino-4-deoxy-L-arabinose transferase-like glycosyltransferase